MKLNVNLSAQEKRSIYKEEIIVQLGMDKSLSRISALSGFPSYNTIIAWAEKDELFKNALITARTAQGLRSADKANEIVDGVAEMMTGPMADIDSRLYSATLQHLRWNAERTAKEAYGPQMEVKHTGQVNIRTSFLIPRSKQSVDDEEVIDLDVSMAPAQLESGDDADWMG